MPSIMSSTTTTTTTNTATTTNTTTATSTLLPPTTTTTTTAAAATTVRNEKPIPYQKCRGKNGCFGIWDFYSNLKMNLLSSVEIPVEIFSIDATKYRFDSTLRKTITKQVVAKELNETLNTQNFDIIMGHLREKERNPSHYECIELLLIFIHTSKGSTKWT